MSSLFSLQGHVALVTGASGGLGSHFSRVMAHAGARVVLSGRRLEPLNSVVESIVSEGGEASAVAVDVRNALSVTKALDAAESTYGTIDTVVCNAGIGTSKLSVDLTEDDWFQVLDTNLSGCWRVANGVAKRLIAADKPGNVINITSVAGHRVNKGMANYMAAKAGLEHLTHSLAVEWARHQIRVNAIAPGYIETDLNRDYFATPSGQAIIKRIPQRRLGQAEDLDGALLLLASDASRYMTGSTIVVDGGHMQASL